MMPKVWPILLLLLSVGVLAFLISSTLNKDQSGKEVEKRDNLQKSGLGFFQKRTVSVDDDPFMGSKNAPITLIEFSDFECGNCKLFFLQTLPLLKGQYINTGKINFVYRDFPVKSHDPLATQEAMAAECAREEKGDEGYFKYHDELFSRTKSGGKGLEVSQLFSIANALKIDEGRFKECFESEIFLNEVRKDYSDGMSIGVTGTPTFFLGKSSGTGTIEGVKISGAMPYAAFQILIEELLKSNEKGTN